MFLTGWLCTFPLLKILLFPEKWQASCWPPSVILKRMGFSSMKYHPQLHFAGVPGLLSCWLLYRVCWMLRCLLPADKEGLLRGVSSHRSQLPTWACVQRGSVLPFFCSFPESESWALWGKPTQKPRTDCGSGVSKGSSRAPAAGLRQYRVVAISGGFGLGIWCSKWLPQREHIWRSITFGCDKSINYSLEHWDVPLAFSRSLWAPITVCFRAGVKGGGRRMIRFSFTLGLSWSMWWW